MAEVKNTTEEVDPVEVVNLEGEDPKNLAKEQVVIKVVIEEDNHPKEEKVTNLTKNVIIVTSLVTLLKYVD